MSQPAITARRLTKRFGELVAVDGIDFELKGGECFGLLGPNGAGKTTTARMIHALTPITAGDLVVLGLRVDREPAEVKRRLGVVPQEENLDPDLTPWENLLVFARYFDIPRVEARRRATDLLEFVGLTARAGSPLDELSGGMKRRLLIIALLALLFACLSLMVAALARSFEFFNYYLTLVVTPMFLFCGVFFPLSSLPRWAQGLARFLPLTYAVEAARALMQGRPSTQALLPLLWLAPPTLAAFLIAAHLVRRRLIH
jgi:ABC-type transport system involved in cytochrome c biogenesis ATPase subunit